MARKPKGKGKAPETPESPGGATGRGMERQGEEGRLRGLVRYPPGSNGGVHRGPDRQLRINVVRSIFLEALAKDGVRLAITTAGRRRRHRSKIPMALVENLVTRIQEIAFSGSDGDVLRLVFGIHAVFQPGKHERDDDTPRPRPATFVVAPPTPSTEESGQALAHPTVPDTLVDANGQEYVAGFAGEGRS